MNGLPRKSPHRDDWCTPEVVLGRVRQLGPVGLDPCANARSVVGAARELRADRDEDGLAASWSGAGLIYVNPPYGRALPDWLERCAEQGGGVCDDECIALVPAATDTRWFSDFCATADALCFWRGRLTFLGAPSPAMFPSLVAYWGGRRHLFRHVFSSVGWCP